LVTGQGGLSEMADTYVSRAINRLALSGDFQEVCAWLASDAPIAPDERAHLAQAIELAMSPKPRGRPALEVHNWQVRADTCAEYETRLASGEVRKRVAFDLCQRLSISARTLDTWIAEARERAEAIAKYSRI
jgi:hypothetical protein